LKKADVAKSAERGSAQAGYVGVGSNTQSSYGPPPANLSPVERKAIAVPEPRTLSAGARRLGRRGLVFKEAFMTSYLAMPGPRSSRGNEI
jgi:hypothetical protein